MKVNVSRVFTLVLLFFTASVSAQNKEDIILKMPAEWKYERIDFPLDFAPDISYKGFEELRFAPGMFDTLSSTYFTYVFALSVEDDVTFKKKEIKDFLRKYYVGLSNAVAKSKKITIDESKIKVTVDKKSKENYTAEVIFIDTFTNAKEVVLFMDIEVYPTFRSGKTMLIALVSPQKKKTETWSKLYKIKSELLTQ